VPVINLAQWPLEAALFDGDAAAGPIPTIFTEDPEATRSALETGAAKAHHDLQRVAKALFMPEMINFKESLSIVRKPRY
jgi:hypothetical protein